MSLHLKHLTPIIQHLLFTGPKTYPLLTSPLFGRYHHTGYLCSPHTPAQSSPPLLSFTSALPILTSPLFGRYPHTDCLCTQSVTAHIRRTYGIALTDGVFYEEAGQACIRGQCTPGINCARQHYRHRGPVWRWRRLLVENQPTGHQSNWQAQHENPRCLAAHHQKETDLDQGPETKTGLSTAFLQSWKQLGWIMVWGTHLNVDLILPLLSTELNIKVVEYTLVPQVLASTIALSFAFFIITWREKNRNNILHTWKLFFKESKKKRK